MCLHTYLSNKNAGKPGLPGIYHKLHKPDFVSKLSFIWDKHCCLPLAAYPGSSGGPPSNEPIHGITAPKVYPCKALLQYIVSFYLTFSPLPEGGYFLWHYLLPYPFFQSNKTSGSSPVGCPVLSGLSFSSL